ncbi:tetratricopeptide repeat protein [Bremerella sp.]|uniref:tetratricopeptide repeat protein n=1 Tax=Bremerella sp. TaxID=2795602 RepID=UPI00391C2CF7
MHRQKTLRRQLILFSLVASLAVASTGCQMAASGYNVAGVRAAEEGQPQVAVNQFQKALGHDPTNPDAYYNLAATYHQMGKQSGDQNTLHQAEALYNQCLDLNPNHTECHRGLAVLLVDTQRSDKAFTLMERWEQRSPQLADPKIELARLYQEFGDKENAMNQLNQALAVDANNSRAWAAIGSLREQNGELGQALANYQRSYQLNNLDAGVGSRIAALQRQGIQSEVPMAPSSGTQLANQPNTRKRY